MKSILLPAFHRYPTEGAIIGRMVMGYGELELMLAVCTAAAIDADKDDILRAIFRYQSEGGRIRLADALLKQPLDKLGLANDFAHIKHALIYCKNIRNQYAHCQWGDTEIGLWFANLDDAANKHEGFDYTFLHVDLELITLQEAYFATTRESLFYLEHEISVRQGLTKSNPWKMPKLPERPLKHYPPEQYPYPAGKTSS
jgi:hypothetical protein